MIKKESENNEIIEKKILLHLVKKIEKKGLKGLQVNRNIRVLKKQMNHMAEQFSYRTWFDKWHQIYKETTNENNLINETLSQVMVNPNVI